MTHEEFMDQAKVGSFVTVRLPVDYISPSFGVRVQSPMDGNFWVSHCQIIAIEPLPQTPAERIAELEARIAELEADDAEKPTGRIEWGGGACPVADGVRVKVWLRDAHKPMLTYPEHHWWERRGFCGDIIAYQVIP